jgi:hypothetical protein
MKLNILSDEELQKFTVGYIDYPEKDGELDMAHPIFTPGAIRNEWREIAQAQLDKDKAQIESKEQT